MSPFQAILDYELKLGIPPGWINYAISQSGPQGAWSQIERGLVPLDESFFAKFNEDLHRPHLWRAFCAREAGAGRRDVPPGAQPVVVPPLPALDGEWLFNHIFASATAPDPWMLPALQRLRESGRYILGALSNTVIFPPGHALYRADFFGDDIKSIFDVFVSSAHVGLRKPDPEIYRLALERLNAFARGNAHTKRGAAGGWGDGVKPGEVLFLDDIGENLKAARAQGFGTIKVHLGRAFEAVEELEKVTGLSLAGSHQRVPTRSDLQKAKM